MMPGQAGSLPGLFDQRLVHRGDGGDPADGGRLQPVETLRRGPGRRTTGTAARDQGTTETGDDTMGVEQRHHVEAAVTGCQLQGVAQPISDGMQIAVGECHQFGSRGGARSGDKKRDLVGTGRGQRYCRANGGPVDQRLGPQFARDRKPPFQHRNLPLLRHHAERGFPVGPHDHGLRLALFEQREQTGLGQVWADEQGATRGPQGEQARRRVGACGGLDGDPIGGLQPEFGQAPRRRPHHSLHLARRPGCSVNSRQVGLVGSGRSPAGHDFQQRLDRWQGWGRHRGQDA